MKGAVFGLLAVLALGAVTDDSLYGFEFGRFMQRFNKTYSTLETELERFEIFKSNLDMILSHNAQKMSWTMAVNEFADLTADEFKATHMSGYMPLDMNVPRSEVDLSGMVTVPDSIDWVSQGAVTDVKNQGQCGSCWSFSTTGAIEGAVAVKTGRLSSLSEQQLVDCSTANYGCQGGLMDYAFKYVKSAGGLCAESDYAYEAVQGSCQASQCSPVSTITGYKDVRRNSESSLKAAVAQQPVSVAIEADQRSFQFYSGGVMTGRCGTSLDHGVLVVGYGTENGQDFWKVKNSWGGSWGDNGYIKLGRGMQSPYGQCGIAMQPSYPIA